MEESEVPKADTLGRRQCRLHPECRTYLPSGAFSRILWELTQPACVTGLLWLCCQGDTLSNGGPDTLSYTFRPHIPSLWNASFKGDRHDMGNKANKHLWARGLGIPFSDDTISLACHCGHLHLSFSEYGNECRQNTHNVNRIYYGYFLRHLIFQRSLQISTQKQL